MEDISRIKIDELDLNEVASGTKTKTALEVVNTHRGMLELPAFIAIGEQPGPTLLAVAGVHGNEYEGQEAIRRVFESLEPSCVRGKFLGIPVCNLFAYEARSRCTPPHIDGLNLARVFPGKVDGTPTEQLAYALMQLVLRNLGANDLFVDFHSASEDSNYVTMVGFRDIPSEARGESEEAARHFGGCPIWVFGNQHGMFNAEVARAGIPSVGTETTGQAGCRPHDVDTFENGLLNLLRYKKMLGDTVPPRDDSEAPAGTIMTARATGFMRLERELGDEVVTGELIGEIITIFGDKLEDLTAPSSGRIWMRRTVPAIQTGETVCIIGVPNNDKTSRQA